MKFNSQVSSLSWDGDNAEGCVEGEILGRDVLQLHGTVGVNRKAVL